jgi:hypothetical protein
MPHRPNPVKQFADRLAAQARSDPKKATVLAVLVVVMGVMWARLVGGSAAGPRAATASDVAAARSGAAGPTGAPDVLRGAGPANARALASLQEWVRKPIVPLSRNLFVVNYDYFPQDGSKPAPLRAPHGDGFWDQVAKSMTQRADQKREREVLVENLRLQAAQLKVQSTVMGASPKALINGRLVGEGAVVASFRVSKIEARKIVVEREGIKLELRLN